MQQYYLDIKDNIQKLIQFGKIIEANELISDYEKVAPVDLEVISMKAIIAILQNNISTAEEILLQGLALDQYYYDLLYNLAYVYEQLGRCSQAIFYYKRARRSVLYDIQKRDQVDLAIAAFIQKNSETIAREEHEDNFLKQLDSIKTILFVDFDLSMETNRLAKMLSDYGIDVDLAYVGKTPQSVFCDEDLPYRKTIATLDIDGLLEYANQYKYDILHAFPSTRLYAEQIKTAKAGCIVNFQVAAKELSIEKIIKKYSISGKNRSRKKENNFAAQHQRTPLTILIPTYNRPKYLSRLLSYFNTYQCITPNIMVLDSSPAESKKSNREICTKISRCSIRYLEFDQSIDFFVKVYSGLEKVDTEFVCLCADDDFIAEEGLSKSLEVLINQKDLFSVKGKNLYYIKTMSKLSEYDLFSGLYDNEPLVRLEKIVRGFVPSLIYQVFRTERFKNLYSYRNENKQNLPLNLTFQEYLFYFMVILTGKIAKIDIDFNIRDKGVPRETEVKNFPHALIEGTFNQEYRLFRDFLIDYGVTLNIPSKNMQKKMDSIFSDFLINFLGVPRERVMCNNGEFDLKSLEIGMKQSWVWPQ